MMTEYLEALRFQINLFECKHGFRPGNIVVSYDDYKKLINEIRLLRIYYPPEDSARVFGIEILRSPDLKEGSFKLCMPDLY